MAGQAKLPSSSSDSSPLLKISGERASLLHEDELTPKGSGSFSEDKPLVLSDTNFQMPPPPLRLWRKLAYAIGAMPYAMCNTVVGFYLSIFLLEVAILDPVYVLTIVFSGRVWDAITDPLVGYLCTRTKTRWGRLRPWMVLAALPAGVVYIFLWFVPSSFDEEQSYIKFIYYLCMYFAFQALLTCIHVPYTALTMHLSNDNKERDSATLYRMCFEVAGTLLGILVYTLYYTLLANKTTPDCTESVTEPNTGVRRAYWYHALTLGVLIVVFIVITFLGVKEQKEEINTDKKIGFFSGLREIFSFRPYLYLLLMFLFSWLAISFVQGNAALYVKYSVGLESQYPYVIALLLVSTILWMPVWQLVLLKFGKKTAFFAGMWILMPTQLLTLFVPYLPYSMYPLATVGGLGVSCAYLLPWSMLPDVVDEAAANVSNVRREELFYAFFVFGNKLATGVTLGISTGIYKLVGYDQSLCEQPWTVSLTLRLLMSVPPILFTLISLIFLHLYPITEQRRERTKRELKQRRKHLTIASGGSPYGKRRPSISISSPKWKTDPKNTNQTGL